MNKNIPILITSCIFPIDNSGKLSDPELRIKYTLEGLLMWRQIAPHSPIIICDSSNYDFSSHLQKLNLNGIEQLKFFGNSQLVKKYGKGYGEGEIIEYALNHSMFMSNADSFIKCTAKLWVNNFHKCAAQWDLTKKYLGRGYFKNVFSISKPSFFEYIDTRFFIATKKFFFSSMLPVYQKATNNPKGSIEYLLLEKIQEENINHFLFKCLPIIQGMSGGSAKYYKSNPYRVVKDRFRNFISMSNAKNRDYFCR
jgi:hypothetical protein